MPLASVMLADTRRYFDLLNGYRDGDVDSFVEYVSTGAAYACAAAKESARALAELPQQWHSTARPRANSTEERLLTQLLETPILNADTAQRLAGTAEVSVYRALGKLTDIGILEVLSSSKRNQVWAATDVLAELDALSRAIGKRVTESG